MPLVESRLSPSVVRTLSLRRLTWERAAQEKLDILSRLRSRLAIDLSNYRETTIESSFSERIFAELFNYTTLFSSAVSNFEIYPKRYAGRDAQGRKRYDDFSIGIFGSNCSRVIATVELKGPKADLDKAQGKPDDNKYEGKSPAEQAIATAELFGECKWIVVSNFIEIRLYKSGDNDWSARAFLDRVRNRDDLALLLAHFDRRALIGINAQSMATIDGGGGELLMTIDKNHPAQPVEKPANGHRLVLRSGPSCADPKPLFMIETALRIAIRSTEEDLRWFITNVPCNSLDVSMIQLRAYDGWLSVQGESKATKNSIKIAVSRYLETVISFSFPDRHVGLDYSGVNDCVHPTMHHIAVQLFLMLLNEIAQHAGSPLKSAGTSDDGTKVQVECELLDARGLTWNDRKLDRFDGAGHRSIPMSDSDVVRSGPFALRDTRWLKGIAINLMQELAVYFRSEAGGFLLDQDKLASKFTKLSATVA